MDRPGGLLCYGIPNMKLDKSVFEATMMQLNTVQNDLHEIRADIRELLKCQNLHK